VLGDVAGGVGFDEQVEVAGDVVGRDWGVGADDFFGLGAAGVVFQRDWQCCGNRDVLPDWEAKDGCCGGEGEAVAVDVLEWFRMRRWGKRTLQRCERLWSSL
jgi:hypothetical protein